MRRAYVISVDSANRKATVLFSDINIQKVVSVMMGVIVAPGDVGIVLFNDNLSDCILIGVV